MSSPTKPTKPTATIENLPPEMICELFEYLHPKDLAACSMVNKRWHSIYAAFKKHRLVVKNNCVYPISWYSSNRPIAEADRCSSATFRHLAEKPLLSKLSHLILNDSDFRFDLNRFQQLVHLEIHTFPSDQREMHLNLPRLKVLLIYGWNRRCDLSIDCPLLSTLVWCEGGPSLLDVKQPETIKKLETNMIGWKLDPFKSVECLVTRRFEAISKATLLSLPRLRELRYNENIEHMFEEQSRHGAGTVDRLKRTLSEFLDEAKRLRGSDFRLNCSGFQLTKTMLDQIDFVVQVYASSGKEYVRNEYVYMKNYHLIEPGAINFIDEVNYTRLLSTLPGEIPRCFFQKFTHIDMIIVDGVVKDPAHLLRFLKSLRFLSYLDFENTQLSQEFYDKLPASAPLLFSFDLREGHCENELQLNFDFIAKLSGFSKLQIEPPISLESFLSLVPSLGRLIEVEFYVGSREEHLKVLKGEGSTEWMVCNYARGLRFETENPAEIVNFVQEHLKDT